jgi:hypothetical protein
VFILSEYTKIYLLLNCLNFVTEFFPSTVSHDTLEVAIFQIFSDLESFDPISELHHLIADGALRSGISQKLRKVSRVVVSPARNSSFRTVKNWLALSLASRKCRSSRTFS